MDLDEASIVVEVIFALTIVVLMVMSKKLFEGSRSKIVEISSPLRHILKDNQTYCLTSLWMMRLVQMLLLLTFIHYMFLIVLILLPAGTFQSFYLHMQGGSLYKFCHHHKNKGSNSNFNGYSGLYLNPQVMMYEIIKYLMMLIF